MIKFNRAINLAMFSGLVKKQSFDFQFFSGQMPTRSDAEDALRPSVASYPSLYILIRNLGLRSAPELLCNFTIPLVNNPDAAQYAAFPEAKVRLSTIPHNYSNDFDFYNEGQADWFICTAQTYYRAAYPLIDNNADSIPAFIVFGSVGDLGSGADVEMNNRNITADINLKSSDLNMNFDRLIRMEV